MLKLILPMISLMIMNKKSFSVAHTVMAFSFFSFLSLLMWSSSIKVYNSMMMSDALSSSLVTLTLWITMLMVVASIKQLSSSQHLYLNSMSVLAVLLVLSFMSSSLFSFFIFFEVSLIPTMFIVMIWGYQPERIQASFYLMLYTVCGSLPLLLSLVIINSCNSHLFILCPMFFHPAEYFWWGMTILAFLIKMPVYGVHLWLPKAHVEAPVAGSMVLAGILLKLGGYGLIRVASLFQGMNLNFAPFIVPLTLVGASIASLICLRQADLKSMIAYSSVAHMGLMTAGIMTNSFIGWSGALMMMIAHGLSSSGLFAAANMSYESTSTRSFFLTKGLLNLFPVFSMLWLVLCLCNMAAPPTLNLLSEIALISSLMLVCSKMGGLLFVLVFLAAGYSLHLYTATSHGQPPSYLNPSCLPMVRNLHVINMHMIPAFFLFLIPEVFM